MGCYPAILRRETRSRCARGAKGVMLVPVQINYNKEITASGTAVYNYIPANGDGTPKVSTDITVNTLPNNSVTISGTPTGTLTPSSGSTDSSGNFKTTFVAKTGTATETFSVTILSGTATSAPHPMLPAHYRTQFHVTGYSTPCEANFSGPKVTATTQTTGRNTQNWKQYNITSPVAARSDFLGSVAIEGEGYLDNGTHVVAHNHTKQGTSNPIMITCTISTDNQKPQGSYAPLVDGQSCAVTAGGPIPPKATVYIVNDQDQRSADDTVAGNEKGGLYHIDLYCGFDKHYADTISEDNDDVLLYNY
jgi:hypothetical protein